MRSPAAEAVLEADLAEAAGHDPPEAAGGAAQQAAALAGDGREVVHGAGAPTGRGGPWPGRAEHAAPPAPLHNLGKLRGPAPPPFKGAAIWRGGGSTNGPEP